MRASDGTGGGKARMAAGTVAPSTAGALLVLPDRPAGRLERVQLAWWPQRWDGRAVALLAALAFALRVPTIGRGYWVDEGISVGIAGHPLHDIPALLRHDGSPPLFYYLLHFWLGAFGSSPVATHFLPLLISLGVVFAAAWAGRTLFGRAGGLAAAGLAATNPFVNWYATETRMYTLVCGLGLVAITLVVRAERDRRSADAVGAVLCFAALLYTHNWSAYLVTVTVVTLLWRAWRTGDRQMARATVMGAVAVGVLYLPWLPSFVVQARTTAAPWAVPPGIGDLIADPSTMMGGTLGVVIVPLLVLGGIWAARTPPTEPGDGGLADVRAPSRASDEGVRRCVGIGLGTLALGWTAAQVDPSWTVRYLAVGFGPLALAAAGWLARSGRGQAIVAAVCSLCAGWAVIGALLPNPGADDAKSNVAAVTGAARSDLRPGDVVVVAQTEQLAVVRHYLGDAYTYVTPTGPVGDPTVVNWTDLVRRLDASNVCSTVLPSVAALPPGGDVLEITPLKSIGSSGSAWSEAANGKVEAIDRLLAGQRVLLPTRSYAEGTDPRPFSGVVGELFVKQVGADHCT